jgi:transglutaminase-like putative cysteine protease
MSNTPIEMVVEGKEKVLLRDKKIECYRIKSVFKGITIRSWLDEEGNTIKEESPLGLILIKESKADALSENWSETTKDIIAASAISVNKPITLKSPSYLKVRLGNINLKEFNISQGRQQLTGDVLEVFKEKMSGVDSYSIPHRGSLLKYLDPTPFIQSDNKTIIKKAQEIISNEKDALEAVNLINMWVYQNIEKKPTLSIPSALDVLKVKVGDCNEHATLFVALCRSVGIPSKLCAGIVYNQGSFYYHAWSDVFVGRWISVDPTMNQLPADATHIRFVEGGLDKQLEIIKLIGVLKLEVLDYT